MQSYIYFPTKKLKQNQQKPKQTQKQKAPQNKTNHTKKNQKQETNPTLPFPPPKKSKN